MSWLFIPGGQSIGVSTSSSVLPMDIQDWFPLGWTGLISLLSKGLSRVFSSTTFWRHQLFSTQPFLLSLSTAIHDYWENHSFDYMNLYQLMFFLVNMLSRFVIAFLPRSKHLLISLLQSPSAVIWEPPKITSVTVSIVSPSICREVMGLDIIILVFWMLSFKPAFSLSSFTLSRGSLVPLCFLLWEWCHLHVWGYWCFFWQSWFQLLYWILVCIWP